LPINGLNFGSEFLINYVLWFIFDYVFPDGLDNSEVTSKLLNNGLKDD